MQFFLEIDAFFDFEFKNTSHLIFLGLMVPLESFFFQEFQNMANFLTDVMFLFSKFSPSCRHIGGTPCRLKFLTCWGFYLQKK